MAEPESSFEFTGEGPWMTVVNPDVFMTWYAQCGEKFRKGGKAQRIEGGYGYRCDMGAALWLIRSRSQSTT